MEVKDQQRRQDRIDANPPRNAREGTLIKVMASYLEKSEKSMWESASWSTSCSAPEKKRSSSCRLQRTRGTNGDTAGETDAARFGEKAQKESPSSS